MRNVADAYALGVQEALEKLGATRGLKEIRKAIGAGDMGRADMLAKAPGVLSPTNQMGSQIRDLGRGGEGLATLVAHPQHGVSVRKLYDPDAGAYSREVIDRKAQLGNMPNMADFHGQAETRHGTPVHFNEFVQGQPLPRQAENMSAGLRKRFDRAQQNVQTAGAAKGLSMADLRPVNAVQTPTGKVKFIDSMPFKPNEVVSPAEHAQMQARSGEGILPLRQDARHLFDPALNVPGHWDTSDTSRLHMAALPGAGQAGRDAAFKKYMITGNMPAQPQPRVPYFGASSSPVATGAGRSMGSASTVVPTRSGPSFVPGSSQGPPPLTSMGPSPSSIPPPLTTGVPAGPPVAPLAPTVAPVRRSPMSPSLRGSAVIPG